MEFRPLLAKASNFRGPFTFMQTEACGIVHQIALQDLAVPQHFSYLAIVALLYCSFCPNCQTCGLSKSKHSASKSADGTRNCISIPHDASCIHLTQYYGWLHLNWILQPYQLWNNSISILLRGDQNSQFELIHSRRIIATDASIERTLLFVTQASPPSPSPTLTLGLHILAVDVREYSKSHA